MTPKGVMTPVLRTAGLETLRKRLLEMMAEGTGERVRRDNRSRLQSEEKEAISLRAAGSDAKETAGFPGLGDWHLLGRTGATEELERDLEVIFDKNRATISRM